MSPIDEANNTQQTGEQTKLIEMLNSDHNDHLWGHLSQSKRMPRLRLSERKPKFFSAHANKVCEEDEDNNLINNTRTNIPMGIALMANKN
jgi:hypothetical protein